ncbi:MAG: hypothetical protein Q7R86_02105, partial [bacterium]|nr:hypothetical protein [bacterium]
MDLEIDVNGKKYISVASAARLTGYNSDYIGQLCRGKLIVAVRVGRRWFVDQNSLIGYLELEKSELFPAKALPHVNVGRSPSVSRFTRAKLLKSKIVRNFSTLISSVSFSAIYSRAGSVRSLLDDVGAKVRQSKLSLFRLASSAWKILILHSVRAKTNYRAISSRLPKLNLRIFYRVSVLIL